MSNCRHRIPKETDYMNYPNCPICSRNMKSFVTTTKWGHKFHNRCVRKWYGTKYNDNGQDVTCPMCRESIKSNMKSEYVRRAKDVLIQLHDRYVLFIDDKSYKNSKTLSRNRRLGPGKSHQHIDSNKTNQHKRTFIFGNIQKSCHVCRD